MWRPACERDDLERGWYASIRTAKTLLIDFAGTQDNVPACQAPGSHGQGIRLTHCSQVAHQFQGVRICRRQGETVGNRQGETRALQNSAEVSDFGHRRNAGGQSTAKIGFRLGQRASQFRQCLPAKQDTKKKTIRFQCAPCLYQLPDRIIRPM